MNLYSRDNLLRRALLAGAATSLALAATAAQAQETASGGAGVQPAAPAANEVVVTGSHTTRSSLTLSGVEIQKILPGANPELAIQTLPGVTFESADPWGNDEQNISLYVHGFNQNQLGFTLDGVPLGDQSYGNFNGLTPQRAVISENVSGVTLTSGAAALGTASTSNLGGAIVTTTSNPTASMGARVAQTFGSYDAFRTYARLDSGDFTQLGGDTAMYLSFIRQDARSWEYAAHLGGYQVNGKLVRSEGRGKLTLYFDWSSKAEPNPDSVAHNAGGLVPYYRGQLYPNFNEALAYVTANGAPPANNPANYTNYYGDAQRTDYLSYLKYETSFGDTGHAFFQMYYHTDSGQGQIAGPVAVAGLPALFAIYYPNQNLKQVFGGSGYALRTTEYGIWRGGALTGVDYTFGQNEVEAGLWYEHNYNSIRRRWYAFPINDPATPYEYADPALRRLTQYGVDVSYDVIQPHIQDTWRPLPGLVLQAGFKSSLQFDNGYVPVQPLKGALTGLSTGLPSGHIDTREGFLPAVGATYELTSSDQLFANIQKNVRQFQASVAAGQSPYNLGSQQAFNAFKRTTSPESSWTYEGGLRSHHAIDLGPLTSVEGQIDYYHVDFSNRLLQVSATPIIASVLGGVNVLENVGGVTTNGVDISATLHFGPHFSLYDAVSYNHSIYDSNYTTGTTTVATAGKIVPDTAEWLNKTVASFNWGPFEGQVFGDFVGKRYATYTDDQSIPGRFLLSLQAAYHLGDLSFAHMSGVKIAVNATNLTQWKGPYEEVVGAATKTYNTYAAPPRMVFVTLSGQF